MQPRGKKTPAAASQHLGSAILLGLLTLAFLIIPTLTGRPPVLRHTGDPGQPERHAGELLAQTPAPELTPAAEFQGPPVPAAQSSRPAAAQDPWAMPVEGAQEPPWAPNQVFIQKVQLVSLLLVVFAGLIWLTLKGINRFLPGVLRPAAPRKPLMEVLERQNVAPGINLALVRIGEKTVVLGMTEHSVNTLVELSPAEWEAMQRQEEEVESPETPPAAAPNPRETYGKIFNHYMSIIPGWGASKR